MVTDRDRSIPDEIKRLGSGWAVVACPGRTQPRITRMLHPESAR